MAATYLGQSMQGKANATIKHADAIMSCWRISKVGSWAYFMPCILKYDKHGYVSYAENQTSLACIIGKSL